MKNYKSSKYKDGKKVKEKKYRFSGLEKLTDELITMLTRNASNFSIAYQDIARQDKPISAEDKKISLINELDFLRDFFITTVTLCQGITEIRRAKEDNPIGRKRDTDADLILNILIYQHLEKEGKLPTGQELNELFYEAVEEKNKQILAKNKEIAIANLQSKSLIGSSTKDKQELLKPLQVSQSKCHQIIRQVKVSMGKNPNYFRQLTSQTDDFLHRVVASCRN